MKRYCIVYVLINGDPGTAYCYGDDVITALKDFDSLFLDMRGKLEILSITKVS